MAALGPFSVAPTAAAPAVGEALSGVFGSISLTAWICLLLPQLITNYKNQSADGLSMAFLFVWLVGDIANLSGALVSNLAPTAVALASYFCIADVVLIAQCTYYNSLNARRAARAGPRRRRPSGAAAGAASSDEDEPLLARQRSDSSAGGLPGSHRRHSVHHHGAGRRRSSVSGLDPLARIITGEDETPDPSPWAHNALSLLAVYAVGAAGWFVSYKMGAWDAGAGGPDPAAGDGEAGARGGALAAVGLGLGYASAVCYLCARIPQIIKNWREKSCEGLALLFFLLSLTGNMTYGASLFAYSQDRAYLLAALPWLLGSLGTMVEDCVIFVQFRLYAPKRAGSKTGADGAAGAGGAAP